MQPRLKIFSIVRPRGSVVWGTDVKSFARFGTLFVLAVMISFWSGCFISTVPFYKDSQVSDVPWGGEYALVGAGTGNLSATAQSNEVALVIYRPDGMSFRAPSYTMVLTNSIVTNFTANARPGTHEFQGTVFRLATNLFLDISPCQSSRSCLEQLLYLPLHTIGKVQLSNDTIRLSLPTGLDYAIKTSPGLRDKLADAGFRSTADAQSFLSKYADDTNVFKGEGELIFRKIETTPERPSAIGTK
jgi:hypothetical protein